MVGLTTDGCFLKRCVLVFKREFYGRCLQLLRRCMQVGIDENGVGVGFGELGTVLKMVYAFGGTVLRFGSNSGFAFVAHVF